MSVKYRLEQFWQLVRADPLPASAWGEIEQVLTERELALFRRYAAGDRQHAYRVLRTLREEGYDHPALLSAALLHDVGKTRCRLHLWERVVGALAEICCPAKVKAWGQGEATGWRRAFVIRRQHPAWGAAMAAAAGSSALAVSLIRNHQEKEEALPEQEAKELLRQLQRADDQN